HLLVHKSTFFLPGAVDIGSMRTVPLPSAGATGSGMEGHRRAVPPALKRRKPLLSGDGMKKSLLALALGAAFAAPAAYADVTLSGSINMGLAYGKKGDSSTNQSNSLFTTGATVSGGSNTGITTTYTNITISSV